MLRMPNFHFTEEEIEAVTMAVLSFNTDKVGEPLLAHNKVPELYYEQVAALPLYQC